MKDFQRGVVVFLYGPPGSGKGTQAKLLAEIFGFFHFDSGDFLRRLLRDPSRQKDPVIRRERKLNEAGKLNTPSWFLGAVVGYINSIIERRESIVFSGAIRTLYEAFGDEDQKGLIQTLEKMYGKKNLFFFVIDLPFANSIERNKRRLTCSVCGSSLISGYLATGGRVRRCPLCAGKLVHRVDDDPKIVRARLAEYSSRTAPIFAALKRRGYPIIHIDGRSLPYLIHEKITHAMASSLLLA
ncbi:nucleoside monophosphate kinase [Candidatus Wolfebacteria bacterium]|nr:nucleoside monophosphate kinase [Candidatus Wolfebacteria bacterium]